MAKKKVRTQVNWSAHTYRREVFKNQEGQKIIVDHLQKGSSPDEYICFINDFRGLTVKGDFSDWVFCRNFYPSADSKGVNEHYWIEKLEIANPELMFKSLDFDRIHKYLKERFEELNEDDYTHGHWKDIQEWKKEILSALRSGDELEYSYMAYRESNTLGWENEDFPYYKKVPIHLEVVFDAFEEICKRLAYNSQLNNN